MYVRKVLEDLAKYMYFSRIGFSKYYLTDAHKIGFIKICWTSLDNTNVYHVVKQSLTLDIWRNELPGWSCLLSVVWHAGLNLSENQNKDIKDNKQKLNEKWKILMSIKVE